MCVSLLLRDLSGLGAIAFLRIARSVLSKDTSMGKGVTYLRYGFYLAIALIVVWASAIELLILYWFLPMFTWLIFIFRVRSIAEHSAIQGHYSAYASTRTTCVSLIERIFVAPKNVNYHIEHHLYPSVPFHRLPQLHALLLSKPAPRCSPFDSDLLGSTEGSGWVTAPNFSCALDANCEEGRFRLESLSRER